MTVRTETIEYGGYEIRLTEWCGSWQASLCPLLPNLPRPSDETIIAAASLDAALEQARLRVDRLIKPPA